MTIMIHTVVAAPIRPQIRIELGFFAKMVRILVRAHRHSREAQNLLSSHDALLKDIGLTRLKTNRNTYLFSHRN